MGCRVHLYHLAGLGQVGHSSQGNQWESWDPGLGPNVVGPQFSHHQLCDQHEVSQVDIFAHGWLAGQLQLAGWLATKQKCQSDLPRQKHLVTKCVTTSVRLTCGQMYPQTDILWPSMILLNLWVRLTFGQMYPHRQRYLVAKCDTTVPLGQFDLWSDVPPQAETSYGQVWYYFRSGWPVYLRVCLVPAAMVIPAPLAYIKVVAVKKLTLSLFV